MKRHLFCVLLFLELAPSATFAQSAEPTDIDSAPHGMRYDLKLDGGITLGATAVWGTLELLAPTLTKHCRWCDRNSDGSDALNGFDAGVRKALRWHDTATAGVLSTVFSFGLAPLAGIGIGALITAHDDRLREMPADLLVVAESAMLTMVVTDAAKVIAARERPYVHARTPADRAARHAGSDNLSFFSGHTSLAFALATSAGTIGSMRHYRLALLMWIPAMVLAATSAYLRIAADRHYATDVITGMIAGSAIGFAVPYFAHRPRAVNVQLGALPLPGGAGLFVAGAL